MLVDHRTYTVKPGTMAKQVALYQEYGLKPQTRHLGPPLAWLITETGEVNTYVHIWVYKDAADRAANAPRWLPIRNGRSSCRRAPRPAT